jgi:hypothetical protein
MEALVVVEGIVIVLLVILVAGLLRSHAEILRQLADLGGGEPHQSRLHPPRRLSRQGPVAVLTGNTTDGGAASFALSGSRGHTLLAFLSTTCVACGSFWQGTPPGLESIRTLVVTKGEEAESPAELSRLETNAATTVMSTAAWEAFAVPATPYFALIDNRDGRVVGEGSAPTWEQVGEMVNRALADERHSLRRSTRERKADTDEELARAGIEPGDPRLFQPPLGGDG